MDKEIFYKIKLKQGKIEFEVMGDKDFVIELYEEFKERFLHTPKKGIEDKRINDSKTSDLNGIEDEIEIPLDVYLEKFDVSGLQQKFLAIMLYLIEVKKLKSFRSRDVNNILKENNYEPFQASATHIQRMRDKGLISIIGKEGNESIITIYRDNIENAKKYITQQEG